MKKIVIAAEVFSSNLGDYAIYDSLSTLLSLRDIEAIPLDISFRRGFPVGSTGSQPELTNRNWKSLIPKKMKHHKLTQHMITSTMWYLFHRQEITKYWSELISSSDAVIIGGGQLLTDTTAGFLTKLVLITDIANKFNKPICILGCGVGSDLSKKARNNIKKILNSAKFVSLRDIDSANRLKSFIRKNISLNVYPDLAFALSSATNNNNFQKEPELKKTVCAFNIMPLNAFKKYNPNLRDVDAKTYIIFWKQLAQATAKENMQIHIVTNGSIQDYEQAKSIYESILSEGVDVRLLDRPASPLDLYDQISNVDYLITMRMHAGIIGKAYGKSVSTLMWDDKISGVWQEAGDKQVAINSDIILNPHPWNEVKSAFEASNNIVLSNLNKKISTSVDKCLEVIYN